MEGHDLQDALETAYGQDGDDEVCVICRSNKHTTNTANKCARGSMGMKRRSAADETMVVKNDYFWAGKNGRAELIANGEPLVVQRVHGVEACSGTFRGPHGELVERRGG